jgi:nitric oxide synthase oxygenase domain/subunit
VFGPKSETGNVSAAARSIQSHILSLMGRVVTNGVIQHAITIAGPRSLPEANTDLVRYGATYEIQIHP